MSHHSFDVAHCPKKRLAISPQRAVPYSIATSRHGAHSTAASNTPTSKAKIRPLFGKTPSTSKGLYAPVGGKKQTEVIDVDALSSTDSEDGLPEPRKLGVPRFISHPIGCFARKLDTPVTKDLKRAAEHIVGTRNKIVHKSSIEEAYANTNGDSDEQSDDTVEGVKRLGPLPHCRPLGHVVSCSACKQDGSFCAIDDRSTGKHQCVACRLKHNTNCNMFVLLDFKPLRETTM